MLGQVRVDVDGGTENGGTMDESRGIRCREPTIWDWTGWTRRGLILLCPEKVSKRKGAVVKIRHTLLDVYDAVDDAVWGLKLDAAWEDK